MTRNIHTDVSEIRDAISPTLPSGTSSEDPATSAGLLESLRGIWVELRGIGERLMSLSRVLARPAWFDVATGALRIIIASGTVTTVSTVTNMGTGVDAKSGFTDILMRENWNTGIRRGVS